jgi:tetratricopeptide (TPR) repeat protein
MQDFYEVLGIEKSASQVQIKAAFKRMAMKCHPDRNPGNKEAEELFKVINEAYHTLSDPTKKMRYDSRFLWIREETTDTYWQDIKRRRYERWKQSQENEYRFDKNYFKIQGLAFLVFLIMAGFCFGVINTAHYYVERKYREKWNANSELLRQVNGLFGEDRYEDALSMINVLEEKDPLEYRFGYARDSLMAMLRHRADAEFMKSDFTLAVTHYVVLSKYENPVRFETLQNMSLCQYYLGNYRESLQALKHLHNQQPNDVNLIYQIGYLNLHKLDNPEEALQYLTLGKKAFKEKMTWVYGKAFEVLMDPADAPDIYYRIFHDRAVANMKLSHFKDAVTDCNWAVFLRPMEGAPYHMRAASNIRLKSYRDVCEDATKALQRGVIDADAMKKRYCY